MRILLTLAAACCLSACDQSDRAPSTRAADREAASATTAEAHSQDEPTASPIAEVPPAVALLEQDLAYGEADKSNLIGYLAMPADAAEPLPGLIVIHEWWGLNDNVKAMTRRLAGEGYVALAVDLYGGASAETPEQAQLLMARAAAQPDIVKDNLRQAYEYLENYAFSPAVASIGWCFGGGWSLQAALMLPRELDAMVMYYGRLVTDEEQLRQLEMPILGLFAELDETIPVRDVADFRQTLRRLGKDANVVTYPGVGHAFANPSGGNYDANAAEQAWQATIDFLDANLK